MDAPAAPQIVITIAARFGRVSWKYSSLAYALILKDVGVLIQTLYLMATDMGLGGCAIGSTNIDLFAQDDRDRIPRRRPSRPVRARSRHAIGDFRLSTRPHEFRLVMPEPAMTEVGEVQSDTWHVRLTRTSADRAGRTDRAMWRARNNRSGCGLAVPPGRISRPEGPRIG